ncbi:MAG: PAS domain S-box protein [Proteobacteria bacterium]|nr:PAS domain S-box protein [Pseudomonadota bacterium]
MTSKKKQLIIATPPLADASGSTQAEVPRLGSVQAAQALRRRAEQIFQQKAAEVAKDLKAMTGEELQKVLHELQVHQIQLEMQNEELRRAQVELDASRARYFNLYDLAPVGYCTISERGLILEANLAAANLLGVVRGELTKRPISRFIFKEDQDVYYLLCKSLFLTREPQAGELRLVRQDGTSFWAHLETTVALTDSGETVSRLMLSDITNRKRAEEALQESHRLNEEILDSITDAFISLTDNMIIRYFNSAAERILNQKRIDVIGRRLADVFPEVKRSIFEKNYAKAIRTNTPLSFEAEFTTAPYRNWYDVRVYPNREGGTIYFQVITERKQAEEAKAKLESVNRQVQKAESLGRMAGAIAHHFNNKLQVVKGFLELTLDVLQPGDPSIDRLTVAMKAADQAVEVSRMMLTYLGKTLEKREPLDLSEICRKISPMVQAAMPKNLGFKTDLDSPGPTILANAKEIQQILINLVTNAWEAAGDDHGDIYLTAKTVASADISSSFRFPANWQPCGNAYACLEVRDNGCGIADKDLEEVFSPFFSTKFTGRGMGLPVVLGLAQAHQGAVTVESRPGQGSVFRVFLPISEEKIVRQPQKKTKASVIQKTGKVLLVEDDAIVREITSVMLSTMGFTVLRALDGIEAVEKFRQHKDEILFVLSDVAMPRMNGWETLIALRQIVPGIPMILASGYSEEQVMERVHSERPQFFLGKPYGFKDLRDAINRALADHEK